MFYILFIVIVDSWNLNKISVSNSSTFLLKIGSGDIQILKLCC